MTEARARHEAHARLRIERALRHLQQAQAEVSTALNALSSICGAAGVYTKGHKVYDQIHAYWYKVADLRLKKNLRLDHEPEPDPAP